MQCIYDIVPKLNNFCISVNKNWDYFFASYKNKAFMLQKLELNKLFKFCKSSIALTSFITNFAFTVSVIALVPRVGNATESIAQTAKEVVIKDSRNTAIYYGRIYIELSFDPGWQRVINCCNNSRTFKISPGEYMDFLYGYAEDGDLRKFASRDFNWFKTACRNGWPSGAEILPDLTVIPFCNPRPIYEVIIFNMSTRYLSKISCEVYSPSSSPESCSVSRASLNPGESATVTFDMTQSSQGLIKWVTDSGRSLQVHAELDLKDAYSFFLRPKGEGISVRQIDSSPFFWQATFTQTGTDPD